MKYITIPCHAICHATCGFAAAALIATHDFTEMINMDDSEILVERYLRQLGLGDVVYEPDGNIPPDFVVGEKIAVEVRRLNQNHVSGGRREGLENAAVPLWKNIREHLSTFGAPKHGKSWLIFYSFGRPVSSWKVIRKKINDALEPFVLDPNAEAIDRDLEDGFRLTVRSIPPRSSLFVLLGSSDQESGGWLLDELDRNLKIVIQEKTGKIAPYRAKYPIWWLIMPDHIAYGMDDYDLSLFRDQITVVHSFDKIVLLDPRNHLRAVEI